MDRRRLGNRSYVVSLCEHGVGDLYENSTNRVVSNVYHERLRDGTDKNHRFARGCERDRNKRGLARGGPSAAPDYPTFRDGHVENMLCDAVVLSDRERHWVEVAVEVTP